MIHSSFLLFLLASMGSFAADDCKVIEEGKAFFDSKKSAWTEDLKMRFSKCEGEKLQLSLIQSSNNATVESIKLVNPSKNQNWVFDGLGCNEPMENAKSLFRNKFVLRENLKVLQAWAVNPKTKKMEELVAKKITCHDDEP